jgi:hypothetical protein
MDAFESKKLFRILAEVSRGAYHWIGRLNTFIALIDVFDSKKLFRILAEVSRGAYHWIWTIEHVHRSH